MLEVVAETITNQWLELASLVIAIAALFYAALAHISSRNAAAAARALELANLRIQAKSSHAEAHRSFSSLCSRCRASRTDWDQYERKYMPPLSETWPEPELVNIAQVERDGAILLQELDQYFTSVDKMNASQLEKGFQNAKATAVEIEKLANRLERPPAHFNC